MEDARSAAEGTKAAKAAADTVYTLCVTLIDGPMRDAFLQKNPVVSRTIEVHADQDLDELHCAIRQAFDWDEDHCWGFQIGGTRSQARKAIHYGMEEADGGPWGPMLRLAEGATLMTLGLRTRSRFFYLYDFGASWWHEIRVVKTDHLPRKVRLPRVVARVGKNPPQYPNAEDGW